MCSNTNNKNVNLFPGNYLLIANKWEEKCKIYIFYAERVKNTSA